MTFPPFLAPPNPPDCCSDHFIMHSLPEEPKHLEYDLSLPPSKCRQHLSIVPSASTLYKWRKQIAKADGDSGDFGAVTSQNTDLSGRNIICGWMLQLTVLVLKSIQFSTIEIHFKTF